MGKWHNQWESGMTIYDVLIFSSQSLIEGILLMKCYCPLIVQIIFIA